MHLWESLHQLDSYACDFSLVLDGRLGCLESKALMEFFYHLELNNCPVSQSPPSQFTMASSPQYTDVMLSALCIAEIPREIK